ncbi:hydantoinase/oxoprolinase family protein [Paraburkholderia phenazinium]|uniref:N-methylhydantoinase A n=1 Tax=Paraburkholderia phenazinium TaxID=60549 RepID=A0A1N6J0V3_9BURK|nr:hydantoinase/oxoprolinase family protein [Paraburkholderia phenazinium]SIO37809.1 N-methylhydantoinase A [Paraburkholderia phenazinium]
MTRVAGKARIGADIGGTFTDVVLEVEGRRESIKILTTYDAPERALLEGIETLLARAGLQIADVGLIVHGTTLATNALIERKGAKTALLTTAGFRDVLELASESRFDQYDLTMQAPTPLVPRPLRIGIPERIAADGALLVPLDRDAICAAARLFEQERVTSVAIAFLHSYANPAHEREAAQLLAELMPGVSISQSSEVSPEIREYERFSTTVANAYVQPLVARYLRRLEEKLATLGFTCPLLLMLSSGGLTTVETAARFPVRLVESGPAGGAIFAASVAAEHGIEQMLALDVGGTTAKICFINDARPQISQMFEVARVHRFRKGSGLPLRIPVVEMVEIGAGGGSIAQIDSARRLSVGPHSAGSEPGPACYGRGGTAPTVTDADLVLGRIDPTAFAGGTILLDIDAATDALKHLDAWDASAAQLALGVSEMVDEAMASATRVHAMENGADAAARTLFAFGGAAPLHAARIAEKLGIARIVIPRSAGVGSAVGFLRAPIAYELSRSLHQRLTQFDPAPVNAMLEQMAAEAHEIVARAHTGAPCIERRTAFARYCGQGFEVAIDVPSRALTADDADVLAETFALAYRALYGATADGLAVEVLTWRVSVTAPSAPYERIATTPRTRTVKPGGYRRVMDPASGEAMDFAIVGREGLEAGDHIAGPALIVEKETTTVVSPSFDAMIDAHHYIVLTRREQTGARQ